MTGIQPGPDTSADLRSRAAGFVVMVLVLALVAVAAFVAFVA